MEHRMMKEIVSQQILKYPICRYPLKFSIPLLYAGGFRLYRRQSLSKNPYKELYNAEGTITTILMWDFHAVDDEVAVLLDKD